MLSVFQKRKLTRYFNIIDQDAKGYFTLRDVDRIAQKMAVRRNVEEGSEFYTILRDGMRMIWHNARLYGYSQNPNRVTLADWLIHEENILSREEMREGYVRKITRDVFDLMDTDAKGYIVETEYTILMESFGVETGTTAWAFNMLDAQGKGQISRGEFVKLVEDFHLSEDRSAPGNYLFGAW